MCIIIVHVFQPECKLKLMDYSSTLSLFVLCPATEITGSSLVEFSSQELDGEFDPASHDAAMQRAYGSEFYDQPESDEDKPDLGEEGSGGGGGAYEEGEGLIDWDPRHLRREGEGGGVWEEEEEGEGGGPHCDDPDFNVRWIE